MGNTKTAPAAAEAAPAAKEGTPVETEATIAVIGPAITQEEYNQLKGQLEAAQAENKKKDQTITSLTEMLEEASQESTKVIVAEGPVVEYKGEKYLATQAAFWFKNVTKPVHYTELTEEQKAQLIEEDKLEEL